MDYLQYLEVKIGKFIYSLDYVLNLIINGLPSIPLMCILTNLKDGLKVLNLIINGLPSIHLRTKISWYTNYMSFKPYYKWITFNTKRRGRKQGKRKKF